MQVTKEQLRQVGAFQQATDSDLELILQSAIRRAVEEGAFLFFQGDPAEYFYVLINGQVKLLQSNARGQQVILRTIHPWQVFGALGIARSSATYPVSAQAMVDSEAFAVSSAFYRDLTQRNPNLSLDLMQVMANYVQEMQGRYRELATERVEQRVANTVLRLAAQLGTRPRQGTPIELSVTRQELAEMSGTTLFTVSRLLSDWERKGLIEAGRARVGIIDPHGLVRLAEGNSGEEGDPVLR